MTLIFPNRSRSYDEAAKRIRFVGYDGTFQVPFSIEAQALLSEVPVIDTEQKCLAAFDASRLPILDAAQRAYTRSNKSFYVLTEADLR
ncbi:uncharacterized protein DUF1488 [Pseudaminobacter salicylatoxidans]|uniref:Uncharacterized protein DUF1488 n=1 Tax=Pseudaminobacter salicylatoxidans TaxID=93369 RepID=A0A316CHV4_PSESE|nr:DUF1488 domain-containing protein [Pseudaminobacter salicylatoxidans]PWJ78353.1 uncharacterized protein DUF1488 [Pseudaminobacter salicylatoxidans]